MSSKEHLAYTRIASQLWRDIRKAEEDTLTGDDPTAAVIEHIVEAFLVVDHIAEQRYKGTDEHKPEHSESDSGSIN